MNRIEKWNEITGAEQEQGMMEAFLESRTDRCRAGTGYDGSLS